MSDASRDEKLPSPTLPQLAPRAADSHKGTYGSALLIGGSRGMAGAIAMAGMAALRTGAGLVRLAVPDCCLETVAHFSPCFMTIPLGQDGRGRIATAWKELEPWLEQASCIAIGPGLGQSSELQRTLLELVAASRCPLIIDADGLNNLSQTADWFASIRSPLILTPHPGEWSRLCGVGSRSRAEQCAAAVEFAASHRCILVLKGHRTLITDGQTAVANVTGTPAMATGGSGDVLTGIITALVCQGLSVRDAAHLGVHVHGLAGEIAQQTLRSHVVLPTELIEFLPKAFAQLQI